VTVTELLTRPAGPPTLADVAQLAGVSSATASRVLTGSARAAQTAREKAEALASQQEGGRRKRELERTRAALERQIGGLRSEHEAGAEELRRIDEQVGTQTRLQTTERIMLGRLRQADVSVAAEVRGVHRNGKRAP